jgi:hypothetical protein
LGATGQQFQNADHRHPLEGCDPCCRRQDA